MKNVVWILATLVCACGSSSDKCEPGRQGECSCGGGKTGFQTCLPDGSAWGACECKECTTDQDCIDLHGDDWYCDLTVDECKERACMPDCTGKECGDDGCEGSCGDCDAGEICNSSGRCEAERECTSNQDCIDLHGQGWYCELIEGRCRDAGVCNDPTPHRCMDDLCHACCIDDDCEAMEICNELYECELWCHEVGVDCSRDRSGCCAGLVCDLFDNTCTAQCGSDAECTQRTDIPYHDDLRCAGGLCDFDHCIKDSQCTPGRVCYNGNCVTIPSCADVASCRVSPESTVTQEGTIAVFAATAYTAGGSLAPGMSFSWDSSNDTVASVSGGVATGGATTGTATITATVEGCAVACDALVINYGGVSAGETRVVVIDEQEGTPVQGASVRVGAQAQVATDAMGVAVVSVELSAGNPQDITVWKEDHDYVTLLAVETNDVLVPVRRAHGLDFGTDPPEAVAGGIRGAFDFSAVHCEEGHVCDVTVGLAGLSLPVGFHHLTLGALSGGIVRTRIELGGTTTELPLNAGFVLCLNTTCFKEHYAPEGLPPTRVAWGLGGKTDLSDLLEYLGPILSGGGEGNDPAIFSVELLAFAGSHGSIVPGVDILPRSEVLDVDDLDMNPATTTVPDYDNFPWLGMGLEVGAQEQMTVTAPDLPVGVYDGVVVIAGVVVRGSGFVPLGIALGKDDPDGSNPPDGHIDSPLVLPVSPVAGRLPEDSYQRVLVALAVNLADLYASNDPLHVQAGQVVMVDAFTGAHTLETFLQPPEGTYDHLARTLSMTVLPPGLTYAEVVFDDAAGLVWRVLGEWGAGDYDLPPAPASGDRADRAIFTGVRLGAAGFQDLLTFDDVGLADAWQMTRHWVYAELE